MFKATQRHPKTLTLTNPDEWPDEEKYVAVSYTWYPSEHDSVSAGAYTIQNYNGRKEHPIRDSVLHRSTRYCLAHGAELIWIDAVCVNQDSPLDVSYGLNAMDTVYRRSFKPLALLYTQITTQREMGLLHRFLNNDFIQFTSSDTRPRFKWWVTSTDVSNVETLLSKITSDRWWSRAWTYQEEYRSSGKMCLLIPCSESLIRYHELGNIPGELEVSSRKFREAVTRFFLACVDSPYHLDEAILNKATQYNMISRFDHGYSHALLASKGMTSLIFRDVGERDLTVCADMLSIIGNCCSYSVRLNTDLMEKEGIKSLRACILAFFFLNGELYCVEDQSLDNNIPRHPEAIPQNVYKYISDISMSGISPPVEEKELTFLKSCRLRDVRLSLDGIQTAGWLWQLGKRIDPTNRDYIRSTKYKPHGYRSKNRYAYKDKDEPIWKGRLDQLVRYLKAHGYISMASSVASFLSLKYYQNSFYYQYLAAKDLGLHLHKGGQVQLGAICGRNSYAAIFICPDLKERDQPHYAFTSWDGSDTQQQKYVSLAVEPNLTDSDCLMFEPLGWMNGLWFSQSKRPVSVTFPWPF